MTFLKKTVAQHCANGPLFVPLSAHLLSPVKSRQQTWSVCGPVCVCVGGGVGVERKQLANANPTLCDANWKEGNNITQTGISSTMMS